MRALLALLLALCACAPAHGAFLRVVAINETLSSGWLRVMALYDDWTQVNETVFIPAGTVIKTGNLWAELKDTNYTTPVDMTIRVATPSPDKAHRMSELQGGARDAGGGGPAGGGKAGGRAAGPAVATLRVPPSRPMAFRGGHLISPAAPS